MKKLLNIRIILGLIVIGLALYFPKPKVEVNLLNIEKPTIEIIEAVSPLSNLITDPTDRAKLAIFNQAFANRVKTYDSDLQQVNDVYVSAASNFFGDTMVDKYRDLDKMIISLIETSTGSENHKLSEEEKQKISTNFMGLAWSLVQKR